MYNWLMISFLLLSACQTAQQKNLALVQDRAVKLKPLSKWTPVWCRVETHLTQPAAARYKEMFPEEVSRVEDESLSYTWKARESSCEITPLDNSPLAQSHKSFLDTSMCLLLQAHWVNSPFDELTVLPDDIVAVKDSDRVHIRSGSEGSELGLYLERTPLVVETRTRSRGTLIATYTQVDGEWLPQRLENHRPGVRIVVDEIEYSSTRLGDRRMVKSFWTSVGAEQPLKHSQAQLSECQNY